MSASAWVNIALTVLVVLISAMTTVSTPCFDVVSLRPLVADRERQAFQTLPLPIL